MRLRIRIGFRQAGPGIGGSRTRPSPFAAAGRADLGLPIESRYLTTNDAALGDRFDVIIASGDPTRRLALRLCADIADRPVRQRHPRADDADVEAVAPGTPPGLLIPTAVDRLSPGSAKRAQPSMLLRLAGFAKVEVRRAGGASLVARCQYATAIGAAAVAVSCALRRQVSIPPLSAQSDAVVERDSDLWFGLTARGYREAVNAADSQAAQPLWNNYSAACHRRFGFAPEAAAMRFHDGARETSRETLRLSPSASPFVWVPCCCTAHFTACLMASQSCGRDPVQIGGGCLRASTPMLWDIGSDDGDAEDIAWVAQAEELLCAAERGTANVPERFAALGSGTWRRRDHAGDWSTYRRLPAADFCVVGQLGPAR